MLQNLKEKLLFILVASIGIVIEIQTCWLLFGGATSR
jgi:hypothetical protein